MKRILLALTLALGLATRVAAAPTDAADTVANCGTPNQTVAAGQQAPLTQNTSGLLCTNGGGASGGNDSGPVVQSQTPAASSHAAGTSVGGLFTIPLARVSGGSGAVTQFAFTSTGGSTGQYVVRIWDKSPANTTCTDNTAFAGNFTTDDANLITPSFSISPIAPTVTTGDASTYAALTNLNWDYKNADSTQNLYVCVVTVSTNTADESHAVRVMLSGPQN